MNTEKEFGGEPVEIQEILEETAPLTDQEQVPEPPQALGEDQAQDQAPAPTAAEASSAEEKPLATEEKPHQGAKETVKQAAQAVKAVIPPTPPQGKRQAVGQGAARYLVVLFAVAIVLLLFSAIMQQRNHDDLMAGISTSALTTQKMVELTFQVEDLQKELEAVKGQLAVTEAARDKAIEEKEKSAAEAKGTKDTLQAMEWLVEIRILYTSGRATEARAMFKTFEATGLGQSLPEKSAIPGGTPPRALYDVLKAALG